jgi:hypothetical protein
MSLQALNFLIQSCMLSSIDDGVLSGEEIIAILGKTTSSKRTVVRTNRKQLT